jgi:hypothetical protein
VHFDGFFVFQDPKWGNYNMLSLAEKTRLGLERALPLKKYGCMYLFVFRRER